MSQRCLMFTTDFIASNVNINDDTVELPFFENITLKEPPLREILDTFQRRQRAI